MYYNIGVIKKFSKSTGRHLRRRLFNKVIGLYCATLLKEKTPIQVFSDEFCEILKTPFLENTSRQLLLFYGKIFCQKNNKEPSEKKLNSWHKEKTLNTSKIYLFLFSLLPMIL